MKEAGCPYCGEQISSEARLCKHCDRPVLYSIKLSTKLDEREKHSLFKIWQSIDKTNFKHLPLSQYSQTKIELDTIPLILAWDLNRLSADLLQKQLSEFHVEIFFQGGLPSSFEKTPEPKSFWPSFAYAILAIIVLGGVAFYWKKIQTNTANEGINSPSTMSRELPNLPDIQFNMPNQTAPKNNEALNQQLKSQTGFDRAQIQTFLDATVFIRDSRVLGSGFLITSDGYILSNAHVTSDMTEPIIILHDGRQFTATKIREDKVLDISLIKIPATALAYLKLGDANQLYAGQNVVTIGNPGGLTFTVTRGIVSYVGRNINNIAYIQTDAAINHGNSGGPMITENLEVVGINSLTSQRDQGISFALPINLACRAGGVTDGIATDPASCPDFVSGDATTMQVALENQSPDQNHGRRTTPDSQQPDSNQQPKSAYQEEADGLKAAWQKQEKEIDDVGAATTTEMKSLQTQIQQNTTDLSLEERLRAKLQEAQDKVNAYKKLKAESQLKYVRQIISLIERQKGDPDYSAYSDQLDAQINQLSQTKKELENYLSAASLPTKAN